MGWRKWLIRTLVYTVVGGLGILFLGFQLLTNPIATRRKVLERLSERFPGAAISLDSARLNLLDGINVSELRLARRDDLDKLDFLYVPSAVLYHDKEQVLDGKLALRKVILHRPQFRILIDRNGQCNLHGLMGPVLPDERVPTLVIQQGTIVVEDNRLAVGKPVLEIRNVNLTILNDPLPQLVIDGSGQTDVLGLLHIHADAQRCGGLISAKLELPAVAIGPALVQRVADFFPDLGAHLRQTKANARMQVSLSWRPGSSAPLSLMASGEFSEGQFSHARLPYPLEQIAGTFQCINDPTGEEYGSKEQPEEPHAQSDPAILNLRFTCIQLTAQASSAHLEASLKDLVVPRPSKDKETTKPRDKETTNNQTVSASGFGFRIEDELPMRELTYKIDHLMVTPELFHYLPETVQQFKDDYKPSGAMSITHLYQRSGPGCWTKHYLAHPEGMEAEFIKFPYSLHGITGTIERTYASDHISHIHFDLNGYGGDRPVTLKGDVEGKKDPGIDFEIAATNVPLDERLLHALPARHQVLAAQFHPQGLADIKAYVKRAQGRHEFANRYEVSVHHGTFDYDIFPYRLEQVTGELVILPDHWECRDFHGLHPVYRPGKEFCDLDCGGEESEGPSTGPRELNPVTTKPEVAGEIFVQGRSYPAEPAADRSMPIPAGDQGSARVRLVIRGKDVQVNREFEEALAPPTIPARAPLQRTWRNLGLSGRVNFDAEVIDIPGHPKDIDVGVSLRGCSMKAKFFPYYLSEVGATVHYAHDQVDVSDVQARHGNTQLAFRKAQVLLRGEEGFHLRIGDPKRRDQPLPALSPSLEVHDLVIDSAFLAALPPALRKGLAELKMEGAVDVNTVLVIDQKDASKPPSIWWEGGVALPGNTLVAGVAVKDARGTATSCGLFDGQQLEGLVGILVLDTANVLGQPVTSLRTEIEVAPESPQVLRFRNLSASFFGGSVGGQARVEFSPKLNYELVLKGLGIQLEQFGRNNVGASADLQGQAMVGLYLNGSGTEVVDLKGNGEVDVPNGKLYRLPVLLDMLKTIGLRPPDRTAFEQAHMKFAIENGKLHIQDLDLLGNAVSLRGQGTVNLDGSHVNLDFNVDWGALQVFPSVVNMIPQTISDQLLKIKVRGKIGDVRFEKELMPGLVDPIKRAFGGAKAY